MGYNINLTHSMVSKCGLWGKKKYIVKRGNFVIMYMYTPTHTDTDEVYIKKE